MILELVASFPKRRWWSDSEMDFKGVEGQDQLGNYIM